MKNSRNISIVLFAAILIFGASACTEEKPKSTASKKLAIELDPILIEVNGLVAGLDVTVRLNKIMNCMLANSYSGLQGEGVWKEIVTEQEGLCKLFELAENETRLAFDEIKSRKKLLNRQFVFSVFLSRMGDYDGAFVEEEIGLFSSFNSCAKVEKVARDYNIPTKKCREWKDISELFDELDPVPPGILP